MTAATARDPDRPLVLVTSFEPFGGSPVNPTVEIARILAESAPAVGARCYLTLPVVTGTAAGSAWNALEAAVARLAPDAVVALGESAKADRVHFERVAINLRDARIADNAGTQLVDAPIDGASTAANAYFASVPVRDMLAACEAAGTPGQLSLSAGAFLCNEILYRLLWRAADAGDSRDPAPSAPTGVLRAGFIHVPQLPEQAAVRGGPSMDARASARGVAAALDELARRLADAGGGSLA